MDFRYLLTDCFFNEISINPGKNSVLSTACTVCKSSVLNTVYLAPQRKKDIKISGVQRRATKMVKGLKDNEEQLKIQALLSLEENEG